jgi:hypothetical protein
VRVKNNEDALAFDPKAGSAARMTAWVATPPVKWQRHGGRLSQSDVDGLSQAGNRHLPKNCASPWKLS